MNIEINDFINNPVFENDLKEKIEKKVNNFFNCGYSYPVSTGTIAIEVVLKALDLPRGAAVMVPELSFIATATAAANCGLIPVYADVSKEYFGLTLESIKKSFNDKVKCIILVHFGGFVNREIFEIKKFCDEKNIFLIEDSAQAFPCAINGRHVGTIGDAGTFSFQSNKIVTSGEGGLIITNNESLNNKCIEISNWGLLEKIKKRNLSVASSNFRMSAIQSYLIIQQLNMIDKIIKDRINIVEEFKLICKNNNIDACFPAMNEEVFDCPLFFPIKYSEKINTVEPREECPMSNSTIVKSILNKYYPDLMQDYMKQNVNCINNNISKWVVDNINFINIKQFSIQTFKKLINVYKLKN